MYGVGRFFILLIEMGQTCFQGGHWSGVTETGTIKNPCVTVPLKERGSQRRNVKFAQQGGGTFNEKENINRDSTKGWWWWYIHLQTRLTGICPG